MSAHSDNRAAGAVSLGLSLTLAAVLLALATSADPARQPQPHDPAPSAVSVPPPGPDLAAAVLPPPPAVAPPAPVIATPAAPPLPPPPEAPAPTAPAAAPPALQPQPPEPSLDVANAAVEATVPPAAPLQPPPQLVAVTRETVREGRALLRLLERGEGPGIEIAWPADAAERAGLYHLFSQCFGMRTVVRTADGEIHGAGALDGDRYSGYARQPAGQLSAAERAAVEAVRRRHRLVGGQALRLFPRRVDAVLLGALNAAAGADFGKDVRIRARYRVADEGVQVGDIVINGQASAATLVLPYDTERTCPSNAARYTAAQ